MIRGVFLGALLALLTGCTSLGYRDAGDRLESFAPLPENAQVRHAAGAEPSPDGSRNCCPRHDAGRSHAICRFRSPPIVYVCNDDDCFHRFVAPGWNYTAAVSTTIASCSRPMFDREPHRLKPILLHELSHLHMGQYRGHYAMAIPVWFHEGLASLVASGGGADL